MIDISNIEPGPPMGEALASPEEEEPSTSARESAPKKQRKPKPPADAEILDTATFLKEYWRPRNIRMEDDQELYELVLHPDDSEAADEYAVEKLVDNGPYTLVEKLTQILSGEEPKVSVPSPDPAQEGEAERVEEMLRWWRVEADRRHRRQLNHPLAYDEDKFVVLRGWIASRITLNPDDPEFPWRYRLIDPINVYPQLDGDGLKAVYHIFRDTVDNVVADYPEAETPLRRKLGSGYRPRVEVEVISYWDADWHVVFVDAERIFRSYHNYGFCPWVITLAQGAPYGPTTRNRTEWIRRRGVGALEGLREIYKFYNRLFSALATEVMKGANPPMKIYGDQVTEKQGKQVDTGIGGTTYFDRTRNEDATPVQTGFNPTQFAPFLSMLNEQRNKAGLPEVVWGSGTGNMPGWAISLSTASATDILNPYKRAIELHRETVNYCALKLYAEHIPDSQPVAMITTDRLTGRRRSQVEITASEVKDVGYVSEVRYGRIEGRGERIALINAAAQLWAAKMVDLETLLGDEFIGLENPGLIKQKVLADLIFLNDEWIREFGVPAALQRVAPELLDTYFKSLAALKAKESGSPPGAPPGGGALPNLPPNVLPPEMGALAGLEPGAVAPPGATDVQGAGDAVIQQMLQMLANGGTNGGTN